MNLRTIITISRPRFWFYLAGTYLVGYSFAITNIYELQSLYFIIHFLYFLIPANIFLYGVNDICDEDTDKFNSKKIKYEHLLLSNEKRLLVGILLAAFGLSFILLSFQTKIESQFLITLFLLLSFFYSAPPARLKAKPFVDFLSNILYALPGLLAYFQVTHQFPPLEVMIALLLWTGAMHLFSAIPDISADKKAHLKTTAVVLGENKSLILCAAFWGIVAIIAILTLNSYLALLALIYPAVPLLLLANKDIKIKKVYRFFPLINTVTGFALFVYAIT